MKYLSTNIKMKIPDMLPFIEKIEYEDELKLLQAELVNLQNWIKIQVQKSCYYF